MAERGIAMRADEPNLTVHLSAWASAAGALAIASVVTYSWRLADPTKASATGLVLAAAGTISGALIGFIFGVPRVLTGEPVRADHNGRRARSLIAANTTMLREGGDGARVTALGLMQGAPHVADLDLVLEVLAAPRSPFEQFHALRLLHQLFPTLTPEQQGRVAAAVAARRASMGRDASRTRLADLILAAQSRS